MSTSRPPHSNLPKFLRNDEVTQECQALLSTLPKEKTRLMTLYKYQGFWYNALWLEGVLECQPHFQAQDTDILLATTPKSGTTWLKALMFTLVNRKDCPIITEDHPLVTTNPQDLVPNLEFDLYANNQVPDLASFASPRLFSTHLPFTSLPKSVHESACKLVYLCRDPKDVFVSLWHFSNKLRPQNLDIIAFEETFHKYCKGVSFYGPFWDHILGYWNESLRNPEKMLFLKYEDMKEQPRLHLRRLAQFMHCPFSAKEETEGVVDEILRLCSFGNLRNLEVNKDGKLSSGFENSAFFRRGEVGDWKNYLTAEMGDQLDEIIEEKKKRHGVGQREPALMPVEPDPNHRPNQKLIQKMKMK
ncbi:hypothetical protein RJ640_008026 [Escallonia rubra]|uniref:Sulfotransferase n=1 Tax=Escallonia rubra TaxID=112253 RepID=A0AA88QP17_9ASTE|nr:hypothetical protein RJ640_008026 [Escallonia rubra]